MGLGIWGRATQCPHCRGCRGCVCRSAPNQWQPPACCCPLPSRARKSLWGFKPNPATFGLSPAGRYPPCSWVLPCGDSLARGRPSPFAPRPSPSVEAQRPRGFVGARVRFPFSPSSRPPAQAGSKPVTEQDCGAAGQPPRPSSWEQQKGKSLTWLLLLEGTGTGEPLGGNTFGDGVTAGKGSWEGWVWRSCPSALMGLGVCCVESWKGIVSH